MEDLALHHQWSAAPSLSEGADPYSLVCSTVLHQKSVCLRYSSTYSQVRFVLIANVISLADPPRLNRNYLGAATSST